MQGKINQLQPKGDLRGQVMGGARTLLTNPNWNQDIYNQMNIAAPFRARVLDDGGEVLLTDTEITQLIPSGDWSWFYVPGGRKASTAYCQIPSAAGDLVVTRNSLASAINRAGAFVDVAINTPRLDFVSGSFIGQPVEPLATNTYWPSNMSADYSLFNLTRIENIVTETTANNVHNIEGPVRSAGASDLRAYGVIVRKTGTPVRFLSIRVSNLSDGELLSGIFNAQTGVRITSPQRTGSWSSTGLTSGSLNLGNGYFLYYVVGQTTGVSFNRIVLDFRGSDGTQVYAGSTGVSFECFGFQMETGSFPTSRITTATGSVTRQADALTRAGASGLIGSGALTLYAEINSRLTGGANAKRILTISDGTSNNVVALEKTSTDAIRALVVNSGVEQMSIISGTSPTGNIKVAAGLGTNNGVLYVNGAQIGTGASLVIPPGLNRIDYGQSSLGALHLNDRGRAAGISQRRWANAELENLTRL